MDKVNQKMKKISNLLGGFRSSMVNQPKTDFGIEECLKSENFQVTKISRHGFPYKPTALAFDPIQNLLAIGNQAGEIKILGRPGVEYELKHDFPSSIIQIIFLINEGALISLTTDDQVHMWTLRQKKPEIVHSLKFQREHITVCHLPFQSKWLYVGTERGNVQILNLETFSLSGYLINWNKAMDPMRSTHPGAVVHLSDNPNEPCKLLIGFTTGAVVLWDLKLKTADSRYNCTETLKSISWYQDGKQFMCSHGDGSITTWVVRETLKPKSFMMPHAKLKDNKPESCRPINKVDYRSNRNCEAFIVFSGGMPSANCTPSLTVMKGNNMTVLEMEHTIIDFQILCSTPYNNDFQDPSAIAVLLSNDLVIVDLTTQGYPCFENPYAMDIHESPVTSCVYFADCPLDLIPAYYSVGCQRKRSGYSEKEWPIHGGEESPANCNYPELILTGHADGCLKIWDASSVTLQVLYKLKTGKVFDITRCIIEDDTPPFAIHHIFLCVDSRLLCLAGTTHVMLFRFSKHDITIETPILEVCINYEINDSPDLNDEIQITQNHDLKRQAESASSFGNSNFDGNDANTSVCVKAGLRKWTAGYQPDLCCLLLWIDNESPPPITSISLNSKFGLMAFGDECGIAIIDIVQKICLLSMGTPDLYGSMDPYSRAPRSPKFKNFPRPAQDFLSQCNYSDECKSPIVEQSQDQIDLSRDICVESLKKYHSNPINTSKLNNLSKEKNHSIKDSYGNLSLENVAQDKLINNTDIHIVRQESEIPKCTEQSHAKLSKSKSNPITKDQNIHKKLTSNSTLTRLTGQLKNFFESTSKSNKNQLNYEPEENNLNNVEPIIHYKTLNNKFNEINQPDEVENKCEMNITKHFTDIQEIKSPLEFKDFYGVKQTPFSDICNNLTRTGIETKFENKFVSNFTNEVTTDTNLDNSRGNQIESHPDVWLHQNHKCDNINKMSFYGEKHSQAKEAMKYKRSLSEAVEPTNSKKENIYNSVPFDTEIKKNESLKSSDTTDGLIHNILKKSINSDEQLDKTFTDQQYRTKLLYLKSNNLKKPASLDFKPLRLDSKKLQTIEIKGGTLEKNSPTFHVFDYSNDNVIDPIIYSLTYGEIIKKNKTADSNVFSRSHSSSTTSLENVNKESIECLVFTEAYTRKSDTATCPCLWVGTNLGTVLVISLSLNVDSDSKRRQPVIISPSGTIYRLKGSILSMAFLDNNGSLLASFSEPWKDLNKERDEKKNISKLSSSPNNRISPSASIEIPVIDRQFVIICSEKQARVISLPTQICVYKVKITETSTVIKAEVITFKDSLCLSCYVANGHIVVFSLPSLKPLLDSDYISSPNVRIERTLCFSNHGHIMYMCSPTEIQKITTSFDIYENVKENIAGLFVPCPVPEPPRQSFFKNLFTPTMCATSERDELFGDSSGKPYMGSVKYTPGPAGLQNEANLACSEIGRAKLSALERGEKLTDLEERTERLKTEAEQFSSSAHQLKMKYMNKKWYQF